MAICWRSGCSPARGSETAPPARFGAAVTSRGIIPLPQGWHLRARHAGLLGWARAVLVTKGVLPGCDSTLGRRGVPCAPPAQAAGHFETSFFGCRCDSIRFWFGCVGTRGWCGRRGSSTRRSGGGGFLRPEAGGPLEKWARRADCEPFRPTLAAALARSGRSQRGRSPYDAGRMVAAPRALPDGSPPCSAGAVHALG